MIDQQSSIDLSFRMYFSNAVVPNTVIFPKYRPQIKNITGSVEGNEQSTTDTSTAYTFTN